MTVAVCVKCGAIKHGAWTPCRECRKTPFGEDELTWSLVLSDHHFDVEVLQQASRIIVETGGMPTVTGDLVENTRATVRKSARSLAKRGMMPAPG